MVSWLPNRPSTVNGHPVVEPCPCQRCTDRRGTDFAGRGTLLRAAVRKVTPFGGRYSKDRTS